METNATAPASDPSLSVQATAESAPAEAGNVTTPDFGDPGDETGGERLYVPSDDAEAAPEDGEKPFDLSEIPGLGGMDQNTLLASIQREMQGGQPAAPVAPQVGNAPQQPAADPFATIESLIKENGYDDLPEPVKQAREQFTALQAKHAELEASNKRYEAAFAQAEKQAWDQVGDTLATDGFERYVGKTGARTPAQAAFMRYVEHGTKLLARQYGQFMPPDKINPVEIAKQVASTLTNKQTSPMNSKIEQVARTAKSGQALRRPAPSASTGNGKGQLSDEERLARGEAEFNARRAQLMGKR